MVLDGHQFFAFEIQPVLAAAANAAMQNYNSTEDSAWLSANVNIVTTKVKLNSMAEQDDADPSLMQAIRKGNPLWSEIDAVLTPLASDSDVTSLVAELPRDMGTLAAAPSWTRPALVAGGVVLVAALGYWWLHRPLRNR